MKLKIFFLFTLLVPSFSYSVQHDSIWVAKIINYIKANPSSKGGKKITFKNDKYGLYIFGIYNTIKQQDDNGWNDSYLKPVSKVIEGVVSKKRCSKTGMDIVMELFKVNESNDFIQVKYQNSVFVYKYSYPLILDDCKLLIMYEEKITEVFPATGEGFIRVFEYDVNNDLKLFDSINFGHFD